jgi:hypothetical protein
MALAQNTANHLRTGMANTKAFDEVRDLLELSQVTTAGTAQASKALILDANKDATGVRNLTLGAAGTTQGTMLLSGATSGVITVTGAAAAGTWTFTLPADDGDAGEQLQTNGSGVSTWEAAGSLRAVKNVVSEVSGKAKEALDKLVKTGVYEFTYKEAGRPTTGDYSTHYVGVMAEELPEVMHHNGRIFSPVSAFGMALLAIKALTEKVESLEAQLGQGRVSTSS